MDRNPDVRYVCGETSVGVLGRLSSSLLSVGSVSSRPCLAMAARFLRIISRRASSSAVTAINLWHPLERTFESLAEVRALRVLCADELAMLAAVCGRTSSSSGMTEGCLV